MALRRFIIAPVGEAIFRKCEDMYDLLVRDGQHVYSAVSQNHNGTVFNLVFDDELPIVQDFMRTVVNNNSIFHIHSRRIEPRSLPAHAREQAEKAIKKRTTVRNEVQGKINSEAEGALRALIIAIPLDQPEVDGMTYKQLKLTYNRMNRQINTIYAYLHSRNIPVTPGAILNIQDRADALEVI